MEVVDLKHQPADAVPPTGTDKGAIGAGEPARAPIGQPMAARTSRAAIGKLVAAIAFAGGLLVGWFAIGWWLWPLPWANANPWELQPAFQRRYVALVAAEYLRGGSVVQVQQDLAGWDAEALATLLTTIEREASTAEVRQAAQALRSALSLPDANLSLWGTLLRQKAVFWTGALALLLLAAALALAIAPPNRRHSAAAVQLADEEELQALQMERRQVPSEPWLQAFGDAGGEAAEEAAAATPQQQGGGAQPPAAQASLGQATAGTDSGAAKGRQVEHIRFGDTRGAAEGAAAGHKPEGRVAAAAAPARPSVQTAEEAPAQGQPPETATGGSGFADPQAILSDLMGEVDMMDPHRDVLVKIVEPVDIDLLLQEAQEALDGLRTLPHRTAHEVG